jgi:hypothetical protein
MGARSARYRALLLVSDGPTCAARVSTGAGEWCWQSLRAAQPGIPHLGRLNREEGPALIGPDGLRQASRMPGRERCSLMSATTGALVLAAAEPPWPPSQAPGGPAPSQRLCHTLEEHLQRRLAQPVPRLRDGAGGRHCAFPLPGAHELQPARRSAAASPLHSRPGIQPCHHEINDDMSREQAGPPLSAAVFCRYLIHQVARPRRCAPAPYPSLAEGRSP